VRLWRAGLGLTVILGVIAGLIWGWPGAFAAAAFGLVATVIQVVATRRVLDRRSAAVAEFFKQWGIGMGLRVAGVVLLVAAVLIDRTLFPPLPAALGFLGVLIPLLALEVKVLGLKD